MATDLSQSPYFDDYEGENGAREKGFHKILFRPGYAVQTRELNQLQSIMQKQVDRFGRFVFKDGSLVTGGAFHIQNSAAYVKVSITGDLTDALYLGQTITGESGVTAIIKAVYQQGTTKAFIVKYESASTADATVKTFVADEVLSVTTSALTTVNATVLPAAQTPIGVGCLFRIDEGVIFTNENFIRFPASQIIVDPFNPTPTVDVGFLLVENIVTPEQDETLKDNAAGSFNFAAPGAHRLQYVLGLTTRAVGAETEDEFIQLYRLTNGEVSLKYERPQFADLLDTIAQRTFDESGHYVTQPFTVTINEHLKTSDNFGIYTPAQGGDINKLVVTASRGKAYVKGYEVRKLTSTRLDLDKATETAFLNNLTFTSNVGNFVIVDEVSGPWCNQCGVVSIRDTAAGSITATTYSSTAAPGSEIGTAKFYSIRHETGVAGTAAAQYLVYLFDIQMDAGSSFKTDAKGLFLDGVAPVLDSHADLVLNSSNEAVIYDRGIFPLIYNLPRSNIQKLRDEDDDVDTSFDVIRRFEVNFTTATATATVSAPEVFPFGASAQLSATELDDIIVTDAGTGEFVPVLSATTSSDARSLNITLGSAIGNSIVITRVRRTTAREARKIVKKDRVTTINCNTHPNGVNGPYTLGVPDVISIKAIYVGNSYAVSGTNRIADFVLDTGQRDTFYDHGRITPRSNFLTTSDRITVVYDYFEHDVSEGSAYFSVDSYDVDDSDPAKLSTWEIPTYGTFNLRDCVDARRAKDTTVTSDVTITGNLNDSGIENPSETGAIDPNNRINLAPDRLFVADAHFYLSYYAVLTLDKDGNFKFYFSEAAENPLTPKIDTDLMHIATIKVSPYPSLSPKFAKSVSQDDEAVRLNTINNRRYTFADLRAVDKRLNNVEYYTSLNLVEKNTKDLQILDENDQNRFKNGFFVDTFVDHSVGDYQKEGYFIAIDPVNYELVPANDTRAVDMSLFSTTNTNRD